MFSAPEMCWQGAHVFDCWDIIMWDCFTSYLIIAGPVSNRCHISPVNGIQEAFDVWPSCWFVEVSTSLYFPCISQAWYLPVSGFSPSSRLAWLTPDLISIYIELRSGNHTFIFSYLRRGLRLPGAVYWALRMSII